MAEGVRHGGLEAAIFASPDDPKPYLVYADWLIEQGDGMGELIVLQHGPQEAGERAQVLIEAEVARELGFASDTGLRLSWKRGFVHRIELRSGGLGLLDAVVATRCCAFARELGLGEAVRGLHPQVIVDRLVKLGSPALLERLSLSPMVHEPFEPEVDRLRARFPRLERGRSLFAVLGGAYLEVLSTGDRQSLTLSVGDQYALDPQRATVIGRGAAADLVFAHEGLNGRNSKVGWANGAWVLWHMGGSNPILINGAQVWRECTLADGDVIEPAPGLRLRFGVDRSVSP